MSDITTDGHIAHGIRMLVIANSDPHLNMLNIVQESHLDLILTIGDLQECDITMLRFITNVPKIGIYGNLSDHTYMDTLDIINLQTANWLYNGLSFSSLEADASAPVMHVSIEHAASKTIIYTLTNLLGSSSNKQGTLTIEAVAGSKIITL